jgi:hypothetical protein
MHSHFLSDHSSRAGTTSLFPQQSERSRRSSGDDNTKHRDLFPELGFFVAFRKRKSIKNDGNREALLARWNEDASSVLKEPGFER